MYFFVSFPIVCHDQLRALTAWVQGIMDLEASQPIVKSEFIAVVLAGLGRE